MQPSMPKQGEGLGLGLKVHGVGLGVPGFGLRAAVEGFAKLLLVI